MLVSFIPITNHNVNHQSPSCTCFEDNFRVSMLYLIIWASQQKYHFFNVGFPGNVCVHVNTYIYICTSNSQTLSCFMSLIAFITI